MFVPCPHCQFLVAHHPQLRPLPDACPRCGRPLQETDDAGGDDAPPPAAAPDGSAAVEADAVVPAAQDVPAIAEAASAAIGKNIDRRSVTVTSPIKSVGQHKALVKLHDDVTAAITVSVEEAVSKKRK